MRAVGGLFRLLNYQLIASYNFIVFPLFYGEQLWPIPFFLPYGICLNGVMSPFPTPIHPTRLRAPKTRKIRGELSHKRRRLGWFQTESGDAEENRYSPVARFTVLL